MNHIVIDLEFDRIDRSLRNPENLTSYEIIEIGAVKLDGNYNVTDRFQTFVKPARILEITRTVGKMTGITMDDLRNAPTFPDALTAFTEWAGQGGDFDIYAWSDSDEYQLLDEADDKGIVTPLENVCWIDLQAIFDEEVGLHRAVSLKNAIDWLNIDFVGKEHRASDDAFNTATILQILNDENSKEERLTPIRTLFAPEKVQGSTLGDIFGIDLSALSAACPA